MSKAVASLSALLLCLSITLSPKASTASPQVIVSIKPVHSLVASVMAGIAVPDIMIDGANSPHGFALTPSQANKLSKADLVFWVGPELETFLSKPIKTIGQQARAIELMETKGLLKFDFREDADFDVAAGKATDHDDHKHGQKDDHDDHKHGQKDDHDDHKHGQKDNHDDHKHGPKDNHDDHKHGQKDDHDDHKDDPKAAGGHHDHAHHAHGVDPHIWLDPVNAQLLVTRIAAELSRADPANKARYQANAAATKAGLKQLIGQLETLMEPISNRRFIAFHDAYYYFEKRFAVTAAGTVTVNPEIMPGPRRIRQIKEKIKAAGVTCIFAEPQFSPRIVKVIAAEYEAQTAVLDPLGAGLTAGPGLYAKLLTNMATTMSDCLAK